MERRTIIDTLSDYAEQDPLTPVLFDDAHSRGVTYAQMDNLSGRVYAYLKKNEIRKEDFVLINLPRGVFIPIAMVGVWKAGAAWVLVEDTYAPERIDFIRSDCGCKFELNNENWDAVMHTEPLEGHETPDMHDAAYAVYTSGTTGNPKGVIHEYGNLQRAIDTLRVGGHEPFRGKDRVAVLSPLNFVATIMIMLATLSFHGARIYIVSYNTTKNSSSLARFFLTRRITTTFLTPSYARRLAGNTGPFLHTLVVGSEPANNLFIKGLYIINGYSASEIGYAPATFRIDKAYETCPIGNPQVDLEIRLLDEDGNDVAEGEVGELCTDCLYTRGYVNLPEENKKAFRDGLFHTGDLARLDEDGNYVLLGRNNDMIKINGNRIEPAEIEAAVRTALDIDWCAARGFEKGDKSYLCVYYTADIEIDSGALREELLRRLPYYMIPAYYIKIDEVPVNKNGKLDRKALPEPDTNDFRSNYAAAENDIEKVLCEGFEKVLHANRIGIYDDFYEMGGDSLSSIELVTLCDLPGLNTSEVFRGRTPAGIAKLYEKARKEGVGEDPDEQNRKAMQEAYPLTAEQLYMVDYQIYTPASTMYNLFSMLKFDKEMFDMEQVARAMKKCIAHYPALLTTYYWDEDSSLMQRYTPEVLEDIHVEHISEFELGFVKDMLVYPYKIIGGRLYRCRVFETEKAGYLFFDVHHSVFDGTSMKVFLENFGKLFMGIDPDPDYYYLMLKNRKEAESTEFYEECRAYFEKRYDDITWSCYPKTDRAARDNELGELIVDMGIEQPQMRALEKNYRISRNEFFIAVAALAISVYNKENDIRVCWNYNGRDDLNLMNSIGLLFRELPVGIRFHDDITLRELLHDVHEQVQKGIEHSIYPYMDIHGQVSVEESAYLLYQQDLRDMDALNGYDIELVDIRQNQAASQTILDMEILDGKDGLKLMIDFAASWYEEDSIEAFKDIYVKIVQVITTHYGQSDISIGDIKEKLSSKNSFFRTVSGIFRKKK